VHRRRADVYHAPDFIAPHLPGMSVVATVHDLAFLDWPRDLAPDALRYYRQLARSVHRTAAFIVPSEWTAAQLSERYGVAPAAIHVIPHGVSLNLLRQPVVPRDRRGDFLLAVGTVEPRKRYDLLLDVHSADLSTPQLIIAGAPGWNSAATETRIAASPRVMWERAPDDERLAWLYRHALALVIPSRAEGFGLPAIEAMAVGTPVVSSGGGALGEVTGDAALTVPGADPRAWATAIHSIVDDSVAWQTLSNAGRARAAEFSWQSAAEQTAAVYRSVARD
jgi:glycosyltransferase involved in cell wall biosynthesis